MGCSLSTSGLAWTSTPSLLSTWEDIECSLSFSDLDLLVGCTSCAYDVSLVDLGISSTDEFLTFSATACVSVSS